MKSLNNEHSMQNSSFENLMLLSSDYRELRNGKRYETSSERILCNHGSMEGITNRSSLRNIEGEVPLFQTWTQETTNEQIRGFMAPLTRQLEELTLLVQGMTTSGHANSYPRTELGTTSGTANPQSGSFKSRMFWLLTRLFDVFNWMES